MLSRFKDFFKEKWQDIFIIATIVLIALISFGIGRLTAPKREPIEIKGMEKANIQDLMMPDKISSAESDDKKEELNYQGKVVGSIKSDKYHLPDCPGAKQISEENKIWFESIEAAEKAGYKPAGNCPGLKAR